MCNWNSCEDIMYVQSGFVCLLWLGTNFFNMKRIMEFARAEKVLEKQIILPRRSLLCWVHSFHLWYLQVMSIKAIGIAIKLTLEGSNQAAHFQTWVFVMVAVTCIITQLNYLNKVCFSLTLNFFIMWFCILL